MNTWALYIEIKEDYAYQHSIEKKYYRVDKEITS